MKVKAYTSSHSPEILKSLDPGSIFDSDEYTKITQMERKKDFNSKDSLIQYYLKNNWKKLGSLGFLINYINNNNYKNVLSLGSGEFVLEHLLKTALGPNVQVTGCDFNEFFVLKAKEFFPKINVVNFDFFKDSFAQAFGSHHEFDLIFSFGSLYVLDDDEFVKLIQEIKEKNDTEIIDFHAGVINWKHLIARSTIIKNIFNLPLDSPYRKFIGWNRNARALKKLYMKSGLTIKRKFKDKAYRHVAILK